MACETWEEYKKKEISEKIFFDTFSDITIWCENSRRRFGNYVLREYGWLWRHVEMMIFRLGRLQFEKMDSEWEADLGDIHIRKGKTVISVHIPEGCPLDHAACEKSFRQAYEFWGTELPYVCHSWLLGAELRNFLSEDSNIMKFQQFFDIVEVDYSIREGEERIFGRLRENPELYEGHTSLQKKAKQHLLLGGRLGSGLGILKKQIEN